FLLAAELFFRGWLWAKGTPYDSDEAGRSIATYYTAVNAPAPSQDAAFDDVDPESAAFYRTWHAHPFYGFDNFESPQMIQSDLAAFSGPRDPREYTILVVGGSVAMMLQPQGTAALRARLLADPRFQGRTIRVLDYGRAADKQPQQLMLVAYFLNIGIEPDAVLNLDGFNEAAFGWSNMDQGVHPAYP